MTPVNLPATSEILFAAEHLPDGATLVVPQVAWDDYECLLQELAERPSLRVSYDCGRLEIMSPLAEHDRYACFIDDLVRAYADAFDMELEKLGHTTWKRKALEKGAEADSCYYILNAERIIGKRTIDLEAVVTTAPGHAIELARGFVAREFDVVIAWGGDGTANEVAGPLIGTATALGIVSEGSATVALRMAEGLTDRIHYATPVSGIRVGALPSLHLQSIRTRHTQMC